MRVLFLGDTHGNVDWTYEAIRRAVREGADTIVQCGDFGYWEHTSAGEEFLDAVSEFLVCNDVELIWVDGNHENHTLLREKYPVQSGETFAVIRPSVSYAPRGTRWEWGGVSFLALGGAYSIDRNYRRVGTSFWFEETITDEEADACIAGGYADVMVTHDCPDGVRGAIPGDGTLDRQKDRWPESLENRRKLRRVVLAVQPKLLVHGHYHHRNTEMFGPTRIEGLGCDHDPASILVIDLDDLTKETTA